MKDPDLCRELSRKICKDLGATPFSLGKAGLTHNSLKRTEILKTVDEKGLVKEVEMWYGEAPGLSGLMCCLLAALDESPDIACVIGFKGIDGKLIPTATRAAVLLDWGDTSDEGSMFMRGKEKWIPLSLAQRLQLALGLENMVQEGVLWNPAPNVPEELHKNLSEIIEIGS